MNCAARSFKTLVRICLSERSVSSSAPPRKPQILNKTEKDMNHLELQQTFFDNYKLGASYCRNSFEKGGVCIFVQENLRYVKLNLEKHCKDKDFEVVPQRFILTPGMHA